MKENHSEPSKSQDSNKEKDYSYCFSPQCSSEKCVCEKTHCSYVYKQYGMKRWVYGIIITVVIVGLIVPFFSQVICTFFFQEAKLGLETWNQFVSIILGIVATILSIVSMIMSFKNYDDSLAVHEKNVEILKTVAGMSQNVDMMRATMEKFYLNTGSGDETNRIAPSSQWQNQPKTED